jgi:uncharacterized protein
MKLAGTAALPGAPADVWALLTDPVRLARLLPGCERLDPDGPNRYKAAVKFGMGAVSGKYAGLLEFSAAKPPRSLTLRLEGKGLPGFVKGEGRLEFVAKGSQTEVRYAGEAQVGGLIASVGQRMLEGAARKIAQQFFTSAAAELASKLPADAARATSSTRKAHGKRV